MLQDGEDQRAEHRQRHGTQQNDQWIAERVKLYREREKDQCNREEERRHELASLLAELARLARIIDRVAGRQDFLGRGLEHFQRLVERAAGLAGKFHRVELLKTIERAGHRLVLDVGDGAERDELVLRTADVDVRQLVGVEPLGAFDLRNDLIAAAGNIETVDVVAAERGRKISAHLGEIQSERGHFFPVDDHFRLRLIVLQVD